MTKTICYFGDYLEGYPRHLVLPAAFQEAGYTVIQRRFSSTGVRKYWDVLRLVWTLPKEVDVLCIAYSNSRYVWFVRLLTRRPIVWNAFYSLYDNWVFDRKRVSEGSLKAWWVWWLDYICAQAADVVILETQADIDYWQRTFAIRGTAFERVLLGYNETLIPKQIPPANTDTFRVHFHGWYIPLQGVPVIVRAAKRLAMYPDIIFTLIGNGQTYAEVRALRTELGVERITFLPPTSMPEILTHLEQADVNIGLVGAVDRVDRAIANKVYEAAAMGRVSINADSEAIHELFTDEEDILLIERGNDAALAEAILRLRNDPVYAQKLANAARATVIKHASVSALARRLHTIVENVLPQKG